MGTTSTLTRPFALGVGLHRAGQLVVVGQSTALGPRHAGDLASVLRAAPGDAGEGVVPARVGAWGSPASTPVLAVAPFVVEISADTAVHAGRFRHPVRFVRNRPDLLPADVEPLETGAA